MQRVLNRVIYRDQSSQSSIQFSISTVQAISSIHSNIQESKTTATEQFCKQLVRGNSISFYDYFSQEIFQALQADESYVSIVKELEDGEENIIERNNDTYRLNN